MTFDFWQGLPELPEDEAVNLYPQWDGELGSFHGARFEPSEDFKRWAQQAADRMTDA